MKSSSLGCRWAVFLLACVLASSCITRTGIYDFEVRRGASIEEKIERAKSIVTEARFTRLKVELREKHPDLTDAQLGTLGVRWADTWQAAPDGEKKDRSVTITVIMQEKPGANTGAVLKNAASILNAEINGPDYSDIDRK
jgi:hypothetical protein